VLLSSSDVKPETPEERAEREAAEELRAEKAEKAERAERGEERAHELTLRQMELDSALLLKDLDRTIAADAAVIAAQARVAEAQYQLRTAVGVEGVKASLRLAELAAKLEEAEAKVKADADASAAKVKADADALAAKVEAERRKAKVKAKVERRKAKAAAKVKADSAADSAAAAEAKAEADMIRKITSPVIRDALTQWVGLTITERKGVDGRRLKAFLKGQGYSVE
jgi:membrane protein involved in colicin uptake